MTRRGHDACLAFCIRHAGATTLKHTHTHTHVSSSTKHNRLVGVDALRRRCHRLGFARFFVQAAWLAEVRAHDLPNNTFVLHLMAVDSNCAIVQRRA